MDDIKNNPKLPWDWAVVSMNFNVTMNMVRSLPNKKWNKNFMSYNPNLTVKYILDHPSKDWDWSYLMSKNTFNKSTQDKFID